MDGKSYDPQMTQMDADEEKEIINKGRGRE
jgi:hypothetical protein